MRSRLRAAADDELGFSGDEQRAAASWVSPATSWVSSSAGVSSGSSSAGVVVGDDFR